MQGAEVRSIQALEDLRAGLVRFGGEAEAALRALEMELRRTQEYLGERRRYWEAKVRAAEEEYRRARRALEICRSRGYTDPKTGATYIPPCPQEVAWVERARRQLAECRARLREVLEWQRLVERSAADYHRQAQRMAAWLQQDLPKAGSLLESKIRTLHAYIGVAPGGTAPATFATASPVDAAAGAAALGTLLAAVGIGVAGIAVIRWLSQPHRKVLGDAGEVLAAELVRQEGHLREVPFDQPKHGFDRVFLTPDGRLVILESKVHRRGEFHPGETRFGPQGSPEWIAATAERMADPDSAQWSPTNQRIADLIREMGPENVPVVAVVIETESGLAHVYHRRPGGEAWVPLQEGVSLSDVLSSGIVETETPPHPSGPERESGSELERGPESAEM